MTMHDAKDELRSLAENVGRSSVRYEDVLESSTRRDGVRRVSAGIVSAIVVLASGSFLARAFDDSSSQPSAATARTMNGAISFTVSENHRVPETETIGIVQGPGSSTTFVTGYPDFDTGGWSPDGRWIASTRPAGTSPQNFDIWLAAADGSHERQLTSGPAADFAAQFSPDGQQIMFERTAGERSPALMVMDADGEGLRRIAGADDEVIFEASWSPDGRQIFMIGHPGEEGEENWLAVMDADGTHRRVVFVGAYNEPSWSADGNHIVISSNGRLVVVPVDGAGPAEVLDGIDRQGLAQVAWSPDGANILYTRPLDHIRGEELWVVPARGGAPRKVAEGLQWRDPAPAWSPDGSAIAFVRDGDIWTVDLSTNQQSQITSSQEYESNPAWAVSTEGA